MKLRAKDQIHISSVQADSLRPGDVFEVSDALGKEILAKHPSKFEAVLRVSEKPVAPQVKAVSAPMNKAERAPLNKSEGESK